MKNTKKSFPYSIGIFIFIILIILTITFITILLLNANYPTKLVNSEDMNKENEKADYQIDTTKGKLHSENLWDYYYGKSIDEVKLIAPMFIPEENDTYRLDRSFLDEETKIGLLDLCGIFEDGYLVALGIRGDMGGYLCGFDGGYSMNREDLATIVLAGTAYITLLGLEADVDENSYRSDDFSMMYLTTNVGAKCGFSSCPGTNLSVVCTK